MDSRSGYTSILLSYVYHAHPLKCLDMLYWLYNVSSVLCLIIQWNCRIIFLNLSVSSLDVQFLWSQSCYLNVKFIAFNVSLTLLFKFIIFSKSTHTFHSINEISLISIIYMLWRPQWFTELIAMFLLYFHHWQLCRFCHGFLHAWCCIWIKLNHRNEGLWCRLADCPEIYVLATWSKL
jgi:hypothetical protein